MAILTIGHSDDYWRPAKIDSPLIAHFSSFELQDRKPTRSSSDQLILPSSLVHQTLEIRTWNSKSSLYLAAGCWLLMQLLPCVLWSGIRRWCTSWLAILNEDSSYIRRSTSLETLSVELFSWFIEFICLSEQQICWKHNQLKSIQLKWRAKVLL